MKEEGKNILEIIDQGQCLI